MNDGFPRSTPPGTVRVRGGRFPSLGVESGPHLVESLVVRRYRGGQSFRVTTDTLITSSYISQVRPYLPLRSSVPPFLVQKFTGSLDFSRQSRSLTNIEKDLRGGDLFHNDNPSLLDRNTDQKS